MGSWEFFAWALNVWGKICTVRMCNFCMHIMFVYHTGYIMNFISIGNSTLISETNGTMQF